MSEEIYMDNSTYGPPQPPYDQYYWLVCESLLVILTILTVYLSICLLKHAMDRNQKKNDHKMWQKLCLKWVALASSLLMFLRLCSDHVLAFYGWRNDESCFITVTISTVFFALVVVAIYLFLWVRQSIFYADPLMRKIVNPFVTFLSWFTLAFMILCGLTVCIMYNLPQVTLWVYKATDDGCREVSKNSVETIPYFLAAFTIVFQIALLALFVYPLLSRDTAKLRRSSQNGSTNNSENNHQTSSISHSGEYNPEPAKTKINIRAAEQSRRPSSPTGRKTPTMSPLAQQTFTFEKPYNVSEDTGPESGIETPVKASLGVPWNKTPTIKRDVTLTIDKKTRRKTLMARIRSTRPSSVFYRGSRNCSVSSENTDSQGASDTESQTPSLFGTIRRNFRATTAKLSKSQKKERQRGKSMMIMMKKYSKLMGICIFTDLVAAALQIFFVLPELVYLVIFDVNLMVNLCCVVMTFREWKTILFPCRQKEKSEKTIDITKLKRGPSPQKTKTPDRVQELRKESRKNSSDSASLSGYDSADSVNHPHIYRFSRETKTLLSIER